jgi:hypothetical protein
MMSLESVKKDMTSTPTLSGEVVSPSAHQFICRAPARVVGAIQPKDKSVGPASLRGRQGLSGEPLERFKLHEKFHVHDTDT